MSASPSITKLPLLKAPLIRVPRWPCRSPRLWNSTSTSTSRRRWASDWSHLQQELPARRIPLIYDYLVPTSSHLLEVALADVLPVRPSDSSKDSGPPALPSTTNPATLPLAHHLIYFPPAIPGPLLLPDGTDPLQSPGAPFHRRMWAGGAARFNLDSDPSVALTLDGGRAACLEAIRDVAIKGPPGSEKVFVGIERRFGRCGEDESEDSIRERLWRNTEEEFGDADIVERRNIVFLRDSLPQQAEKQAQAQAQTQTQTQSKETDISSLQKPAKSKTLAPPPEGADFSQTLLPTPKLLFRYSALTYNAHAIHLDPAWCRDEEGHRDLLVHGPLSFTLMLTLTGRKIAEVGEKVKSVEYRNLAPVYCNEPMKVCGRKVGDGKWESWVEGPEGGVCVRGIVRSVKA